MNKFFVILLLSCACVFRTMASEPSNATKVNLTVYYDDPYILQPEIKKSPQSPLTILQSGHHLEFMPTDEPFTLLLTTLDESNIILNYDVGCQETEVELPEYIRGEYMIKLIFDVVSYRGYIFFDKGISSE